MIWVFWLSERGNYLFVSALRSDQFAKFLLKFTTSYLQKKLVTAVIDTGIQQLRW